MGQARESVAPVVAEAEELLLLMQWQLLDGRQDVAFCDLSVVFGNDKERRFSED